MNLKLTCLTFAMGASLSAAQIHFDSTNLSITEALGESGAVREVILNLEESRLAKHIVGIIEDGYQGKFVKGLNAFSGSARLLLQKVSVNETTVEVVGGFNAVRIQGDAAFELFHFLIAVPRNRRGINATHRFVKGKFIDCSIANSNVQDSETSNATCTLLVSQN